MAANQNYAEKIRAESGLFANWPINAERAIGDFGAVNGALFELHGCLDPADVARLGSRTSASAADYDFMVSSTRQIKARASADAALDLAEGKGVLEFEFTNADGIVFCATDASITSITDLRALGALLNERRRAGTWDMSHAVVVETVAVGKATIMSSTESGAVASFEVSTNAPVIPSLIAKLDVGGSMIRSDGIGIRMVGSGPLTPLFKLAALKRRLVGDPKIIYRSGAQDAELVIHDIDDDHVLAVF